MPTGNVKVEFIVLPKQCKLCNKVLNDPKDPKSLDCGGDCLGCIEEIERL